DENLMHGGIGEGVERRNDGHAANELRDEPELEQVVGLRVAKKGRIPLVELLGVDVDLEADRVGGESMGDDLLETIKRSADDEEDVFRVDVDEALLGMLAASLGRHPGHGPLEDLQQCLLYAFTRDVARNRGIVALSRNLVDLVDVDDASLGALHVEIGRVQQVCEDALD